MLVPYCQKGDLEGLKKAATQANTSQPDTNGDVPLYVAAKHDKLDCLAFLLSNGCNPNSENPRNGGTALHVACWYGRDLCAVLLLAYGANPEKPNRDQATVYQEASERQNAKISQILNTWKTNPRDVALSMLVKAYPCSHYPQNLQATVAQQKQLVGWQHRPFYWDPLMVIPPANNYPERIGGWRNSEWDPSAETSRFTKSELVIVSYNVWFDKAHVEERMIALGQLISKEDPDLIALQEMTPHICYLLFSQEWVRKYFVSDPYGSQLSGYGNIILSKVNFQQLILHNFPSNQGRKALCGTVLLPNGMPVVFGTFHLESYDHQRDMRASQAALFQKITSEFDCIILVGDSNMENDAEGENFATSKFSDAWTYLHTLEPATYPTKHRNTFESHGTLYARYDRMFFTPATSRPTSFRKIGEQKLPGTWVCPSDHLGLVIQLRF